MSALWAAFALLGRAVAHYPLFALAGPVLLAVGLLFNTRLKRLELGWLEWSPFGFRANLMLRPVQWRWVWLPYALELAFVMPLLAFMEEWIFRAGTTNWVRGLLWGALAFGVAHLLSLVSVRMVVYMTLVGALFVEVYMAAGLLAVFVMHAVYNLTALAALVATRNRPLKI